MALSRDPLQNKSGSIELNYLPVAARRGELTKQVVLTIGLVAGGNGGPVSCLNFLVY